MGRPAASGARSGGAGSAPSCGLASSGAAVAGRATGSAFAQRDVDERVRARQRRPRDAPRRRGRRRCTADRGGTGLALRRCGSRSVRRARRDCRRCVARRALRRVRRAGRAHLPLEFGHQRRVPRAGPVRGRRPSVATVDGSGRADATFSERPRSWLRTMSGGSGSTRASLSDMYVSRCRPMSIMSWSTRKCFATALPFTSVPLVLPRSSRNESARIVTTAACSPDTAG